MIELLLRHYVFNEIFRSDKQVDQSFRRRALLAFMTRSNSQTKIIRGRWNGIGPFIVCLLYCCTCLCTLEWSSPHWKPVHCATVVRELFLIVCLSHHLNARAAATKECANKVNEYVSRNLILNCCLSSKTCLNEQVKDEIQDDNLSKPAQERPEY